MNYNIMLCPPIRVQRQQRYRRTGARGMGPQTFPCVVLLECLCQVEALLYVIVVGTRGVDVSDAAVASFYFTVLLQSLQKKGG